MIDEKDIKYGTVLNDRGNPNGPKFMFLHWYDGSESKASGKAWNSVIVGSAFSGGDIATWRRGFKDDFWEIVE